MASREEMDTMEVGESVTEQKLNKREKKKNNEAKPAKRRFLVLRNPDSVPETVPSKVAKYEEGPDNGGEVLDKMAAWSDMNLPAEVLRALSEMDYTSPTPIQKAVIPKALENLDIIGAAETGSGKTLAFVIPLICGILDQDKMDNAMDSSEESGRGSEDEESDDEDLVSEFDSDAEEVVGGAEKTGYDADVDDGDSAAVEESLGEFLEVIDDSGHVEVIKLGEVVHDEDQHEPTSGERKLRAIVVSPTRELAKQIWKEACAVAKHTDITVRLIVGGLSEAKQVRVLRQQGADIVVATPGRLWHLIEDGHPVFRDVSNIKYLVIDETDRMLEQNHFKELNLFLSRINEDETASRERQTFVFSATLTRWASKIDVGRKKKNSKNSVKALMRLVKPNNTRFEVIDLTRTQGTAERLNESRILCTRDEKDAYLYYLLEKNSGRILVFTNTIATSQKLKGVCTWLGLEPHLLHGNMSQKLRQVSLESFSATTNCILIATEVAARGLHIPDIDLIIHYDVPKTTEMYIHRSGRTARAFKSGRSVLLILPEEVEEYRKLCRSLEKEGDLKDYPVESELVPRVKERINLAKQIHDCERQLVKENNDRRWWIKAAKDCDLLQSSDNDSSDDEGFSKKTKRKKKKKMTESVKNLSAHSASLKAKLKNLLSRPLVARGQGESKYPARPGRYPFSLNAAG